MCFMDKEKGIQGHSQGIHTGTIIRDGDRNEMPF